MEQNNGLDFDAQNLHSCIQELEATVGEITRSLGTLACADSNTIHRCELSGTLSGILKRSDRLRDHVNHLRKIHGIIRENSVELEKKTEGLKLALHQVESLKERQDGDYFLASLLINPLRGEKPNAEANVMVQKAASRLIKKKNSAVVHSIILSERDRTKMETLVNELARHYGRPELGHVMYTCLHEFLANGVKANIKRVLFQKANLDINNEADYETGMRSFRAVLAPGRIGENLKFLGAAGFYVALRLDHTPERIEFNVFNNTPLTDPEERRIREKFAILMKLEKTEEFFMSHIDYSEGAGLGIAMVISILRNLEINPGTLRIFRTGTGTNVRIVFPLSDAYVDSRLAYESRREVVLSV